MDIDFLTWVIYTICGSKENVTCAANTHRNNITCVVGVKLVRIADNQLKTNSLSIRMFPAIGQVNGLVRTDNGELVIMTASKVVAFLVVILPLCPGGNIVGVCSHSTTWII